MITAADSTIQISQAGSVATVTSVATLPGRAITSPVQGLLYFEAEIIAMETGSNWWGVGITRSSGDLSRWIGQDAEAGVYIGTSGNLVRVFENSAASTILVESIHQVGTRLCVFVNTDTNKVWVIPNPGLSWTYGSSPKANPFTDSSPTFTLQGSGPARIAISPGFTIGNSVRLHLSKATFVNKHLVGSAKTFRTRSTTISMQLLDGVTPISAGTVVQWAWFDTPTLNPMVDPPASYGSAVVTNNGNITLPITTELLVGETGLPVLSTTTGNALEDCRSRLRPVVLSR